VPHRQGKVAVQYHTARFRLVPHLPGWRGDGPGSAASTAGPVIAQEIVEELEAVLSEFVALAEAPLRRAAVHQTVEEMTAPDVRTGIDNVGEPDQYDRYWRRHPPSTLGYLADGLGAQIVVVSWQYHQTQGAIHLEWRQMTSRCRGANHGPC
jgi:hypothetical protein